jgi:hypothetical protein
VRNIVQVHERLFEVYKKEQARLHPFTAADLAAVTLQPGALPAPVGPVLHLAPPGPPEATPEAVKAAKALERQGFIRRWPPAAPKHPPVQDELAGWAVSDSNVPRQVSLAGDLAIIVSTLARPRWIAEVSIAEDPTRLRPDRVAWDQPVRMYAREDPYGLVERPLAADGTLPPYLLGRNDGLLPVLVSWCGLTLGEEPAGPAGTEVPADTITGITSLRQIRFSLPHGEQVRMAALSIATAGGRHWLLDGDRWERATSTTVDDLGPRLAAILKSFTEES